MGQMGRREEACGGHEEACGGHEEACGSQHLGRGNLTRVFEAEAQSGAAVGGTGGPLIDREQVFHIRCEMATCNRMFAKQGKLFKPNASVLKSYTPLAVGLFVYEPRWTTMRRSTLCVALVSRRLLRSPKGLSHTNPFADPIQCDRPRRSLNWLIQMVSLSTRRIRCTGNLPSRLGHLLRPHGIRRQSSHQGLLWHF